MSPFKLFVASAAIFASVAILPPKPADAQIGIGINIGAPPACPWGYFDYAPYACAPRGFYGPGYFYNGVFLGVGPWRNWGYAHGWGHRRFRGPGGGQYHYGRGWQNDPHRGGFVRGNDHGYNHGGPGGDHGGPGYNHGNHGGDHGGPGGPDGPH